MPETVRGRALVDLPAHGVKVGEFVELSGLDALELEHTRHFDPLADEKALQRKERLAGLF